MDLSIERCYDPVEIGAVFTNQAIWSTIAEDGCDPETFSPDLSTEIYMAVKVQDKIIGFYAFAVKSSTELDIHAQILPEYRKKYALASGRKILEWFYRDAPERFQKLTAQVPFLYPNVRDFCLRCGLIIEGVNRASYRKNGKIWDQHYLGITREEIGQIYGLG